MANPDMACMAWLVRDSSINTVEFLRENVPEISRPFALAASSQVCKKYVNVMFSQLTVQLMIEYTINSQLIA